MKVILAGWAKTGTATMCSAFNILGYKTYHWLDHCEQRGKEWTQVLTHGGTVEDFRKMLNDVDVVADSPAAICWMEIHKAFPDSKIILTIRDEDAWYESCYSYLQNLDKDVFSKFLYTLSPTGWKYIAFLRSSAMITFGHYVAWPWSSVAARSEMMIRRNFRQHNVHVLQKAPKDKLLVYSVKEGWRPLCEFLGVEVPDQPFPHMNKKTKAVAEHLEHSLITRMRREMYFTVFCLITIFTCVLYISLL